MKVLKIFLFLLIISIGQVSAQQESPPFKNPNLSIEERVNDLVARMTLEEKISQMIYTAPAIDRLGIPAYNWWNEALHGVARNGLATVFPQAIGLAAMWDTDLMSKVANVISDEGRAKYNDAVSKNKRGIYQGITFWSPNINIFRDPRWGRGMETYGEDPFLTGQLGLQFVKGMQGSDPKYLKVESTPKHFAVHSGPEPDRHTFDARVSDYDLRETYLPHFKKLIQDGKANSVMCAYNRFRGEACCGSNQLLKSILRDEWGFKGYVVSDCWAVSDIYNSHKLVKTPEEASSLAVRAGTDLECGDAYPSLVNAYQQGLIKEDEITTAVKRLFSIRFKLGMFDPPEMVPYSKLDLRNVDTKENQKIALDAARKSIVLLKNYKNILPLDKKIKTVAVIGPNADDAEVLLGNYNGFPSNPVTPLTGILQKLFNTKVIYERGCDVAENLPSFEVIPNSALFTTKAEERENGLKAEYFDNREFKGKPSFKQIDYCIDFKWWTGAPDPKFDPDNFGIRWNGIIVPPRTGKYAIGGYGLNGFRIYFEDSLLISFEGTHHPVKSYKWIDLVAGKAYKIKVEFYKTMRYSFMQLLWSAPDENLEQKAIEAAKKSDAVIMVMGLSPRLEGEEMDVTVKGFKGGDRLTLDLPETQENLIKKIATIGKPIILVLLNGSAVAVNWENKNIPAIIEAWYPGQAAGTAIADVIFGDYNPAGRLPVTFYKSVDQLPEFTDYNMSNRTYRYFKGEPLYPFGYGLSYTTFQYKNLKLKKSKIKSGETTKVYVDVENTGKIFGDEVVQLYVKAGKDNKAIKTLKGFNRISLDPKETKTVEFEITSEKLSRWIDGKGFSVEPDNYTLMIGSSSNDKDLNKIILKVE
ncbi:MAG: glycoside hydrolase family 3 C-terminal domain-containing protein [Ignavibacteriales bacterium]|nr:glycoside hydrolase family 3 C-terminal domain-containing protein [Ignavibacteriales bacterium]